MSTASLTNEPTATRVPRFNQAALRLAVLLIVPLFVYANSLWNGFTYDDYLYILRSPSVTTASFRGLLQPTRLNTIFRPFTFTTFALNWAVSGAHPFSYHIINLLLHVAFVVLLYLVLCKLLDRHNLASSIAFVAALLFAVHPIHTEAVASIAGRSELLAAAFLLLGWLLHLQDRLIPALVAFLLAMFSKESAVVFLPLVIAGDFASGKFKSVFRYAAMVATAGLYLAVLWTADGHHFGPKAVAFVDNPLANLPAALRIPNALRVGWKYLTLLFCPYRLSCDYSYNAIRLYSDWRHTVPVVFASLGLFALLLWALWTGRKPWFLAGAIYLGAFAITANVLVPTGTIMGERLAYLPSAGFCLLLALLWASFAVRRQRVAWAVLVVILAVLGARTLVRNRDWHDNFTLFSADVYSVPASARAHINLGVEYFQRNHLDAARSEFQTGLQIFPDFYTGLEYYGLLESRLGHDQEALPLLRRALVVVSPNAFDRDFMQVNLAAHLMKLGQLEEALNLLNETIQESPAYSRAWSNRAVIHYRRADLASARTDAQTALRLDPSNPQAQSLLSALNAVRSDIPAK